MNKRFVNDTKQFRLYRTRSFPTRCVAVNTRAVEPPQTDAPLGLATRRRNIQQGNAPAVRRGMAMPAPTARSEALDFALDFGDDPISVG